MEIIAEIGQNHNGEIGLAIELIHAAHENGADCAKFQLYDAPGLFPKENNEWYDYNCKTELSREDVELLNSECNKIGIDFMVSVFDVERVAWMEEIGTSRYKIASRSINDQPLIDCLVKTGKALLVSLGMWEGSGFPKIEAEKVDFLYCISKYPTEFSDLHFADVDFSAYSGFSDHTIGLTASYAALARGSRILEKHFTLDKNMYGPDHSGSMTPVELSQLSRFRDELQMCL